YKLANKPFSHLPLANNRVGETVIDTKQNFGRAYHTLCMKFLIAGKMVLGPDFCKIFSKEKLISVEGAKVEIFGQNELIVINLFNIFTSLELEKRRKQKLFNEHVRFFDTLSYLHENFVGVSNQLRHLNI